MKQNLTKIKIMLAVFACIFILASCKNYKKTPSGMAYTITKGKTKDLIKQGQVAKFNVEYKLAGKDTILSSTYNAMPGFVLVDTAKLPKHNFTEILTLCSAGDKVNFVISVDTLKSMGAIQYNELFKRGGTINGKLEILKVFANEKEANEDYAKEYKAEEKRQQAKMEKEIAEQKKKDAVLIIEQTKALETYAQKNNIKTIKTPLGALVEIQAEGTGAKIDTGKTAMAKYRGYLTNGKEFDGNMGASARNPELLRIEVGNHNVIPGLEDAMKYFAKGSKGRVLIPAVLGYGSADNGPIPANSNLVFDIEVIDVLDTKVAREMKQKPLPH